MDQSFNQLTPVLTTIDTLLGFIGVMLVLSLAVTALVQFIQNLLRLRANNLKVGLQALLQKFVADTATTNDPKKRKSEELRDDVLKLAQFVAPKGEGSSRINRWFSPTTTWITEEELVEHLRTVGVAFSEEDQKRLSLLFQRMDDYLRKRFILNVRMITIACAIVVACYFQVSTPKLLIRLSQDEKYRAQSAAAAMEVYRDAPAMLQASTNYQNVSDLALEQLTAKHPEHAALFERASGLGDSEQEIISELRNMLATLPAATQSKLLTEYEKLLEDLQRKALDQSSKQFTESAATLAKFDIRPWQEGWGFFKSPQNIGGILITIIFLTFGAPFWYERLRELVQLRDALKPKSEERKDRPDGNKDSGDGEAKKKSREPDQPSDDNTERGAKGGKQREVANTRDDNSSGSG